MSDYIYFISPELNESNIGKQPIDTDPQGNIDVQNGLQAIRFLAPTLEDYCIAVDINVNVNHGGAKGSMQKENTTMTISSDGMKTKISFMKGSRLVDAEGNARNAYSTAPYEITTYTDLLNTPALINNEMFGMNSINIEYNAYMVPQITIEFTDIRGLSLIAAEQLRHNKTIDNIRGIEDGDFAGSFFKTFFSLPRSRYTMMVKGFYGHPATYEMCYSDFRARFDSNSGNFVATVKFVGFLYSLLADVSVNSLTCAPYDGYAGAAYWASKTSNGGPFTIDGQPMPTLVELCEAWAKAEANFDERVQQSEATQDLESVQSTDTVLMDLENAYMGVVNAYSNDFQKNISADKKIKNEEFYFESYSIIPNMGNAVTTAIANYETQVNTIKQNGVKVVTLDLPITKDRLYTSKVNKSSRSPQDVKNESEQGTWGKNTTSEGQALQPTNAVGKDIYVTDFRQGIKEIRDYRNSIETAKQNASTAIEDTKVQIMMEAMPVKPTIKNLTKIVLAHLDTFLHCIYSCQNAVNAINRDQGRRFSDLNLGQTDQWLSDNTSALITAFPKVTKTVTNDDGTTSEEETWLGDVVSDEKRGLCPEIELVENFINGINEVADKLAVVEKELEEAENGGPAESPQEITSKTAVATSLMDVVDEFPDRYAGYSPNMGSTDDIYKWATLMCFETVSTYFFDKQNKIELLAQAEAINFAQRFPTPSAGYALKLSESLKENDNILNMDSVKSLIDSKPYDDGRYSLKGTRLNLNNSDLVCDYINFGSEYNMSQPNPKASLYSYRQMVSDISVVHYKGIRTFKNAFPQQVTIGSNEPIDFSGLYDEFGGDYDSDEYTSNYFDFHIKCHQDTLTGETISVKDMGASIAAGTDNEEILFTDFLVVNPYESIVRDTESFKEFMEGDEGVLSFIVAWGITPLYGGALKTGDAINNLFGIGGHTTEESDVYLPDVPVYKSLNNEYKAFITLLYLFANNGDDFEEFIENPKGISYVPYYLLLLLGGYYKCIYNTSDNDDNKKQAGGVRLICKALKSSYNEESTSLESLLDKNDGLGKFITNIGVAELKKMMREFESWANGQFKGLLESLNQTTEGKHILGKENGGKYIKELMSPYTVVRTMIYNTLNERSYNQRDYKFALSPSTLTQYVNAFITQLAACYDGVETTDSATPYDANSEAPTSPAEGGPSVPEIPIGVYKFMKILLDTWLSGNEEGTWSLEKLDEHWHFIDVYYNDASNFIINFKEFINSIIACQTQRGYSVMSFLSDVYAKNQFALQVVHNFIDLRQGNESSFKRMRDLFTPMPYSDIELNLDALPDFVVMYAYESSSHVGIDDYEDDGFDLNCDDALLPVAITSKNANSPKIPAFGVCYGEQYQSWFKSIEVGMDNPVITEQAIRAQYEIGLMAAHAKGAESGDGSGQQVKSTLGQDLFTVYSNNSYSCSVTMLGNASIQPLMYFQLFNVPLFHGAYVIQHVTHHISQGNMETKFTGVRVNKVQSPKTRTSFITQSGTYSPSGGYYGGTYDSTTAATLANNCQYKKYPLEDDGVVVLGKRRINEIILHCAATHEGQNYTVEDITQWHKARGWDTIGYHYVIYIDGSLHNGRDINKPGAHTEGHNANSVGICYVGGLEANSMTPKDTRTPAQKETLLTTVHTLLNQYNLSIDNVKCHNQYASKACPSFQIDTFKREYMEKYPSSESSKKTTSNQETTTSNNKQVKDKKPYIKKLVEAIKKTCEHSSALGISANQIQARYKADVSNYPEDMASLHVGSSKDDFATNEKNALLFDAILNTYYNEIYSIKWVTKNDTTELPQFITIRAQEGKAGNKQIFAAKSGSLSNSTTSLNDKMYLSLRKSYCKNDGTLKNFNLFKSECTNFKDASQLAVEEKFKSLVLEECPEPVNGDTSLGAGNNSVTVTIKDGGTIQNGFINGTQGKWNVQQAITWAQNHGGPAFFNNQWTSTLHQCWGTVKRAINAGFSPADKQSPEDVVKGPIPSIHNKECPKYVQEEGRLEKYGFACIGTGWIEGIHPKKNIVHWTKKAQGFTDYQLGDIYLIRHLDRGNNITKTQKNEEGRETESPGHAAIYRGRENAERGTGWISDFMQENMNVYSHEVQIWVYRYGG